MNISQQMKEARDAIRRADEKFAIAEEDEQIESAIFERKAAVLLYSRLIRKVKKERISV